jgi:lysyl-tRNA synthetase class 1
VSKYLERHYDGHPAHLSGYLERLIPYAIRYFDDFIAPSLQRRAPTASEAAALRKLDEKLRTHGNYDPSEIQNLVYEVGKEFFGKENLRDWFKALYEILLGTSQGPRMGSFIALYGIHESQKLIAQALEEAAPT